MSFQDIKGQDRPIELLKGYIKNSRITGSYLFAGEEGIGKKLIAKTLAKALNCSSREFGTSTSLSVNGERSRTIGTSTSLSVNGERSRTIDSCDSCPSCLKIEKGEHPDIHIIESEEEDAIKIEYIRQLKKDINLRPYEGEKKVFIIDNAHNLTADAANAILKVLEEPPANSLIILISAKTALLFKTIVSRCKIIKFYPLQRESLEGVLKGNFHLDNNLAHYLAYFCEGRIGRALRLKDTDILRERDRIISLFTSTGSEEINKSTAQERDNARADLNILAGWFRDMHLVKIGAPYQELINLDRKEELLRSMQRYTFTELYEIFNSLSGAILYLERNINVRLLLSNLKWSLKSAH